MPTDDEVRAMIEKLKTVEDEISYMSWCAAVCATAAAMLRQLLDEREAEFKPVVFSHSESGYTEILLEDCPAYTGKRIEAQLLFRMSDRAVIGATFKTKDANLD